MKRGEAALARLHLLKAAQLRPEVEDITLAAILAPFWIVAPRDRSDSVAGPDGASADNLAVDARFVPDSAAKGGADRSPKRKFVSMHSDRCERIRI